MTQKLTAANGLTIYTDSKLVLEIGALLLEPYKTNNNYTGPDYATVWFGECAGQLDSGISLGSRCHHLNTPIRFESL